MSAEVPAANVVADPGGLLMPVLSSRLRIPNRGFGKIEALKMVVLAASVCGGRTAGQRSTFVVNVRIVHWRTPWFQFKPHHD